MKFILLVCTLLAAPFAWSAEKSKELSLEAAKNIANKAAKCGEKHKWNLSIAIVNVEGNLVYFQRGDGSYFGSIDAAIAKAKSANAFQRPTKAFVEGIKEGRLGLMTMSNIVGLEGGLPIQFGSTFVGAIGISGAKATEDEQCAQEALK